MEGKEEYHIGQDRYSVSPGRYLLIKENDPYGSRVVSDRVAMCPIFFSPQEAVEVSGQFGPLKEEQGLEGVEGNADYSTQLLPHSKGLDRVVARIWQLTSAASEDCGLAQIAGCRPIDTVCGIELSLLKRRALLYALAGGKRLQLALSHLGALRGATQLEIHRRLSLAEDRMRAEFNKPLGPADLARTARMSPYHFARRFSEFHGEPPHRFLTRLRMQHARKLIRETDAPLKEVAALCGYSSLPSFVRKCREVWGVSPGRFRDSRFR